MADSLRLAVSNIGWMPDEDDDVAKLLVAEGVSGVEIAPTKWRERPLNATALDVANTKIEGLQKVLAGMVEAKALADQALKARP